MSMSNRKRNTVTKKNSRNSNQNRELMPSIPRDLSLRVYTFKRTYGPPDIILPIGLPAIVNFQFTLGLLPNFVDFVNLFDSYRIRAVKMHFMPAIDQSLSVGAIVNTPVYTVIDRNNILALASPFEAENYQTCQIFDSTKPFYRTFEPSLTTVSTDVFGNTVTTELSNKTFIDTSNTAVKYLGLKLITDFNTNAVAVTIRCRVEVTLDCRSVN
jgi:hypothetical protein